MKGRDCWRQTGVGWHSGLSAPFGCESVVGLRPDQQVGKQEQQERNQARPCTGSLGSLESVSGDAEQCLGGNVRLRKRVFPV